MADQRLNIIVAVEGAQAAAGEIKGVAAATEEVGAATQTTSKKTSSLRSSLLGMGAAIGVYKAYGFVKGAISTTTDLAKATAGLQRVTGLDAATASGWVATAKERGVQSKQLNMGFVNLAKNINAAASGSKSSAQAFQMLGLNAQNLKAEDTATQIGMIADSIKALPTAADRATAAQKLFGRSGQALLPLLQQGAQGLNGQIAAMAKHTGITNASIKSQLKLVQEQREMNASMLQFKVAVATALVPILLQLMHIFGPIIQAFATLISKSTLFKQVVVVLTTAMLVYIAAVKIAKIEQLAFMATAAPWLALAAAIGVALYMLYTKVGWFRNAINALKQVALDAFRWIKQAVVDVFNWVKANWPLVVGILTGPFGLAAAMIIKNWGAVKSFVLGVFDAIKSAASTVAGVVGGAFKAAWDAVYWAIHGVINIVNQLIGAIKSIASLPGKALGLIGKGVGAIGGLFSQTGGYMSHAGAQIVGEHGPELVSLPQGSQVHPFVQAYGGAGGGVIHTHVYLEGREIAHALGNFVAGQQASR